jgi:S-adenosylmethionine uptake transporter
MKSASLAIGAYSAMLWRSSISAVVMAPVWKLAGGRWPRGKVMRLHAVRGLNSAGMATAFSWGLKYLPLAEGMAISFIAPLIALYLAAVVLGETIGRKAILASLLGLAGVLVIVAGRLGQGSYDANVVWGIGAILLSAVLYAWNLILQSQQAQLAEPREIALFQAVFTGLFLALLAPWLLVVPETGTWLEIAGSAALATISLMLISWGYARENASVLLPLEYSAFIWAALLGWLMFAEALTVPMVAGAALIVAGCLIATRKHTEQTAL